LKLPVALCQGRDGLRAYEVSRALGLAIPRLGNRQAGDPQLGQPVSQGDEVLGGSHVPGNQQHPGKFPLARRLKGESLDEALVDFVVVAADPDL